MTTRVRRITRRKRIQIRKVGGNNEPDWIVNFWNWWSDNISNTIWFRTLTKIGKNIKWFITSIFDFIWYVLTDIVKYGIASGWFIFISSISAINLIDSMSAVGDFTACSVTVAPYCFNFYATIWGSIQAIFSMLGNVTYQLIILILPSSSFLLIASSIILSLITVSFLIIYQYELIEDIEKKERKREGNEGKKKKIKGGSNEKMSRIFHKDVLSKLNSIPKKKMDDLIELHPLPFSVALLFGFIKETDNGYAFSQESLDKIRSNIQNSMTTLNTDAIINEDEPVTKEEIIEIHDSIQAMDVLHVGAIHSLVREALESNGKIDIDDDMKGGTKRTKNQLDSTNSNVPFTPLEKSIRIVDDSSTKYKFFEGLKKEDMTWLKETYSPGFKHAKRYGIVDDTLEFTEKTNEILTTHLNKIKPFLKKDKKIYKPSSSLPSSS